MKETSKNKIKLGGINTFKHIFRRIFKQTVQ